MPFIVMESLVDVAEEKSRLTIIEVILATCLAPASDPPNGVLPISSGFVPTPTSSASGKPSPSESISLKLLTKLPMLSTSVSVSVLRIFVAVNTIANVPSTVGTPDIAAPLNDSPGGKGPAVYVMGVDPLDVMV